MATVEMPFTSPEMPDFTWLEKPKMATLQLPFLKGKFNRALRRLKSRTMAAVHLIDRIHGIEELPLN